MGTVEMKPSVAMKPWLKGVIALPDACGADDIHYAGNGDVVTFLNGRKSYRVGELPHLGAADAKYFT